jgi:hypothetical protein
MSARTATEARGEARVQSDRPDVFISYSRKDEEFVRRLVDALEHRGKDVGSRPGAAEVRVPPRLG